jgi:hypothetical protein
MSKDILAGITDSEQLSGVQSGTSVTGTFTLKGEPNLSGKIDLSSGSDFVPVWSLLSSLSSESTAVGEGLWRVLDNGYVKLTGKLITAKNLGLENKTYPGTLNATFTPNGGTAVVYEFLLFFKVIENQVIGLAIPKPVSDKLSPGFAIDTDEMVSSITPDSLVTYDRIKLAISDILNIVDPGNKIWSTDTKLGVSKNVGKVGCALDNIKSYIAQGLTQALTIKK